MIIAQVCLRLAHCAMIMLYRRPSLVARPWQQPSLNLSHCTTQDHRLGANITEIATIVSRCQSCVWDSQKSCSVFRASKRANLSVWHVFGRFAVEEVLQSFISIWCVQQHVPLQKLQQHSRSRYKWICKQNILGPINLHISFPTCSGCGCFEGCAVISLVQSELRATSGPL